MVIVAAARLAELRQTTISQSNFSSRICGSRTTSFAQLTRAACASCSFLEAHAFTRSLRRNRFPNSVAKWTAGADQ
jgi:hypothetical protein